MAPRYARACYTRAMTMQSVIIYLSGMLAGILAAMIFMAVGRRRRPQAGGQDPLFAAARYAAVVHLKRYGTLTHAVLRDALGMPEMTVERYLGMLEHDGTVRRHGHGVRSFYTRA